MSRISVLASIKRLGRPVFTTMEIASLSGRSSSAATQALDHLRKQGFLLKVYRGIWAEAGNPYLSPYAVIPFLLPTDRAYVSFISALNLHGIIEQIPQETTLASTAHTRRIRTAVGAFSVHRVAPSFFDGFGWYRKTGDFLIAEPEKALLDCLYLSARRKRQYGHFPELDFPRSFSFKKARDWTRRIRDPRISSCVRRKLDALLDEVRKEG